MNAASHGHHGSFERKLLYSLLVEAFQCAHAAGVMCSTVMREDLRRGLALVSIEQSQLGDRVLKSRDEMNTRLAPQPGDILR
jgi:hypothetical protein